ncbi:MAG TPA: hypothetical protein PK969_08010 [Treponemataceae bacterium]|jgi:hypothetical protein|nr:hypothetical protein [Treponemataceae bacterium]
MKKAILFFVIAVSLGAYVFIAGWISFKIPAGHFGVLVSKSGGIHSQTIQPGTFRWHWEGVIPTNITVKTFEIREYNEHISISSKLPSADLYAAMTEEKADFSWSLALTLSGKVEPEVLPELVRDGTIQDQGSLEAWTKQRLSSVAEKGIQKLMTELSEDTELYEQAIDNPGFLDQRIGTIISDCSNDSCIISSVGNITMNLPDIALYSILSKTYRDYQTQRAELLTEAAAHEAKVAMTDYLKLERFAKWGELLDKHPSLIQLIAVTGGNTETALQAINKMN